MSSSARRRGAGANIRAAVPTKPAPPNALDTAELPTHDVENDAARNALDYLGLDLAGRSAAFAEFKRCRFAHSNLSGTTFERATFTDCLFHNCDIANLRARQSSMTRAELSVVRMIGLHWSDGLLQDVRFDECRIDLSSFRFSTLTRVVFDRCTLSGAEFSNADLRGAEFRGCDLTGAQFSHANMEGTRFADCALVDIVGVTSWSGAIVRSHDLITLSHALATALGIQIEHEPDNEPGDQR
jgi:uncharacterized protein YjbI with pentapeptide repeats